MSIRFTLQALHLFWIHGIYGSMYI